MSKSVQKSSRVEIPLHYNKGEEKQHEYRAFFSTLVTETNSQGTVKVIKSRNYPELNEVLEITATSINQSSNPEVVAENLIGYLQQKYNLA